MSVRQRPPIELVSGSRSREPSPADTDRDIGLSFLAEGRVNLADNDRPPFRRRDVDDQEETEIGERRQRLPRDTTIVLRDTVH